MKILVLMFVLAGLTLTFSEQLHAKKEKSRFEKLELFNKVLYIIENQYYREVDTSKLIQGALKGMMDTLDPHSAFLNSKVFDQMQEETEGKFGGVGIEVREKDGILIIVNVIEDSPAWKAGVKRGDKIIEINGETTLGLNLYESVEKMRGAINTSIKISVSRKKEKKIKHYNIKRGIVNVKPVKSTLLRGGVLYLRLIQFQQRSASSLIKAIKKHKKVLGKKKLKGIIFDLRGNPGGLLDEAVSVSSIFLDNGIVVSTEGRDPKQKKILYVKKSGHKELLVPLVVLINGSSASASEIVAGSLQDHKRAVIMGMTSFGKGSVQTIAKIDKDQGLKLTIAQYMTPSGKKIQARGVVPDVDLEEIDENWLDRVKKDDTYLRERDLKNHLNATKETKEEKRRRLTLEKKERKKRIAKLKKKHHARDKKKKTGEYRRYAPDEDYQVLEALKLLQSHNAFAKIKS